jgi:hypothetical protein
LTAKLSVTSGSRDGNDLALLARKIARLFAQRLAAHAQPIQDASGLALHALLIGAAQPGRSERRPQFAAQKDIACDVQVFGQVRLLMDDLNAHGANHVRAKGAHAPLVKIHIAAVRPVQPSQDADEHRLARSAAPGQPDDLAG